MTEQFSLEASGNDNPSEGAEITPTIESLSTLPFHALSEEFLDQVRIQTLEEDAQWVCSLPIDAALGCEIGARFMVRTDALIRKLADLATNTM